MDLGKYNIRCNCLSADPIKAMAAKGIGGFDRMLKAGKLGKPTPTTTLLMENIISLDFE